MLNEFQRDFDSWEKINSNKLIALYKNLANYVTFEILKDLENVIKNYQEYIYDLFRDVNRIKNIMELFNLLDQNEMSLMRVVSEWAQKKFDNKFCCRYLYKGEIALIGEIGSLKIVHNDLLSHLKQKGFINANIYYQSYDDGPEPEGVRVEKFNEAGVFSQYIEKDSVSGCEYHGGIKNCKKYLVDEIERLKKNSHIFIDQLENQIYFKGKLLTSREIKSTVQTIKLIQSILSDKNQEIDPKQMDLGSYAERNEMSSKIISPLQKVARKYFKRKLPITLKGGISTNYKITADLSKYKIVIIE